MARRQQIIASNESCRITLTSGDFAFFTDCKHEVWDTERGELLSQWNSSDALLERLEEADHRLTEEFREWLERGETDP